MKQNRHRPPRSLRNRALEIIAAHPNGCSEAMLAANSIPFEVLTELVKSGLALARTESVFDEDGYLEVTTLWLSEAGEVERMSRNSKPLDRLFACAQPQG